MSHGGRARKAQLAGGLCATEAGSCDAEAYFEDTLLETGWGVFEVRTNPSRPDDEQAYAAGYLEGFLTAPHIASNYANLWHYFFGINGTASRVQPASVEGEGGANAVGSRLPDRYRAWFAKNEQIARSRVLEEALARSGSPPPLRSRTLGKDGHLSDEAFWRQTGLIFAQFDGIVQGFEDFLTGHIAHPCTNKSESTIAAAEARSALGGAGAWEVLTLLNGVGDMLDLQSAIDGSAWSTLGDTSDAEMVKTLLFQRSLCSAIFKVLPDYSDVFMGHSSWFTFSATNRIYKHYHIHTSPDITAAPSTSFSSYAGFLVSLDDFYQMSSGLAMIQTSLNVVDPAIHRHIQGDGLLAWVRVRIANALAATGADWFELFRRENSGTYNNEYMVFDTSKFVSGRGFAPGALWLVEQIPDLVEGKDVTSVLEYGYFPSYNVPYFDSVWRASGYEQLYNRTRDETLTHPMASRGQIFRRDQASVASLEAAMDLLHSNNFVLDPLSKGDPREAICARGDLTGKPSASASGCFDAKVASVGMARNLTAWAMSGPPAGGDSKIPSFSWQGPFESQAHRGLPMKYDFEPVLMRPRWSPKATWPTSHAASSGNEKIIYT